MRTISSTGRLSITQEDYLRAIYLLSQQDGEARVSAIADRLDLSKSTVSERLKELAALGLVTADPYATVVLTHAGKAQGKLLTYKHRVIEVFLSTTLGMPSDQVHREAEQLEHAFSDEAVKRLDAFLHHPTHDPHGSEIPHIN